MKPFALAPLPLLLSFLWPVASAQTATSTPKAEAPTKPDETIVITAPRVAVPLNASAVQGSVLQTLRPATADTASLLRGTPGLSLYGAGGASSLPALHGLADDRLRIKVDGMDLVAACPNHMNPPLSYLDPSAVGSLRVYAGVAPVSVGGDSIGGSIVADPVEPAFVAAGSAPAVSGRATAYARSNAKGQGLSVSARYAAEIFSLSYDGSWNKADNATAAADFKSSTATENAGRTLPLNEVGSTAFETHNHLLGAAWRHEGHLVELRLGFQEVPLQSYPNQRMDMLGNTQQRANLRYRGQFEWGAVEARAYRESVDHLMDFGVDRRFWYGSLSGTGNPCTPIGATCAAGMPMLSDSTNSGLSLKVALPVAGQQVLRLGAEWQQFRLEDTWPASGGGMWPGTFVNLHDGRRDRSALYAEWETPSSSSWMAQAGVRAEQVRMSTGTVRGYSTAAGAMGAQIADASRFNAGVRTHRDSNLDLSGLLRYTPTPALDAEIGVARKVRSPNLYERYTWSTWPMAAAMNNFVGDGNGYVGNTALRPEVAHTVSATVDWHSADRRYQLRASPYLTRVTDFVDAVRCTAALIPGSACPATNAAANQFVILQYANQSARLYGVDLSGQMPLADNALGRFGLQAVVGITRGTNRSTGGNLYNIMPPNARLTLTHQAAGWDSAVEVVAVSAKSRVSAVRNEIRTAGYGLLNLRTSRTWGAVRLDLGIDNLFDRFYRPPLGGAYVGQGRTMSLNGVPWGVTVPGTGRSVYASLGLSF